MTQEEINNDSEKKCEDEKKKSRKTIKNCLFSETRWDSQQDSVWFVEDQML